MNENSTAQSGSWLRTLLELGPPIAFFAIYMAIKEDSFEFAGRVYSGFIVATVAFVPILLASMAALRRLTGKLSRLQILTAAFVIFFGAMTAVFNDERFFKAKTSIVFGLFAAILGAGLLRGRSYLAYVLHDLMPMREEGWMSLTRRLCAAFAALAACNEIVWRTMSTETWVKIETFGFPVTLFGFLWWQLVSLRAHLIQPGADPEGGSKDERP